MADDCIPVKGAAPTPPAGVDLLQAAHLDFRADRLDEASVHAHSAAAIGPPGHRADAFVLLARIARRQGHLDVALAEASRALKAASAAGNPAQACRAHVQHAHALNALGRIEPALEDAYAARRLAEASGDPAAQAAAAEALAAVQWALSQWPEALENFQRMLALAQAGGDLELQAVACGGLSGVVGQLARLPGATDPQAGLERAAALVQDYLRLATQLGDVHAMRAARHNQAIARIALGDREGGRRILQEVLSEGAGGEPGAVSLMNLADLDMKDGQPAAALTRLQTAYTLLTGRRDAGYLTGCCRMLCQAHEALGDTATALAWHRRYHDHWVAQSSERAQMHARALAIELETARAQTEATLERLRADSFKRTSLEDGLTGIANRRAFDGALTEAVADAGKGRPFALVLLDLDHFKQINDRHSHPVGDEVLRRIGRLLTTHCRPQDLAARYGGEEFALVLVDIGAAAAAEVCERIRQAVAQQPWDELVPGLAVRASLGWVHVSGAAGGLDVGGGPLDASALLARADRRLYTAKADGRNRVVGEEAAA